MGLGDEVDLAIFVRDAGRVVAGISGWTWDDCCELQSLWVEPNLRGRGLATRLLAAAEAEAAARGCSQTVHFTYAFQARALYERKGYELVGRVEDFPSGTDVLWYRKRLNQPKSPPSRERSRSEKPSKNTAALMTDPNPEAGSVNGIRAGDEAIQGDGRPCLSAPTRAAPLPLLLPRKPSPAPGPRGGPSGRQRARGLGLVSLADVVRGLSRLVVLLCISTTPPTFLRCSISGRRGPCSGRPTRSSCGVSASVFSFGRPRTCGPELSRARGSSAPGASALTTAELRLLPMLSTHLSFPEIAVEMFLSHHTVKAEAMSISRRLGPPHEARPSAGPASWRSSISKGRLPLTLLPRWGDASSGPDAVGS